MADPLLAGPLEYETAADADQPVDLSSAFRAIRERRFLHGLKSFKSEAAFVAFVFVNWHELLLSHEVTQIFDFHYVTLLNLLSGKTGRRNSVRPLLSLLSRSGRDKGHRPQD